MEIGALKIALPTHVSKFEKVIKQLLIRLLESGRDL